LLQALIFLLLLLDVGSDDGLVPTNGRDEIASGPEMLAYEVALSLAIDPRKMDGALALDVTDHLGDGVFRRNGDHHVHRIDHEVAFLNSIFLLLRQIAEHLAQMVPDLTIEHLPPTLRNKHNVVFARPLRVA